MSKETEVVSFLEDKNFKETVNVPGTKYSILNNGKRIDVHYYVATLAEKFHVGVNHYYDNTNDYTITVLDKNGKVVMSVSGGNVAKFTAKSEGSDVNNAYAENSDPDFPLADFKKAVNEAIEYINK